MEKPDLEKLRSFVKEHSFPTDILIETTAFCNLACVMCPQDKLTRHKGEMSFDLWKKIIDEIVEVAPETKLWPALMGEPLLLGDKKFEMLSYAKEAGIKKICLNSNLVVFEKDMAEKLVKSGVDQIVAGIDAFKDETYESIRVNGDLNKVKEAIRYIDEAKRKLNIKTPEIVIQYIVMDENEDEEQDFIQFWKDFGVELKLKIKPRTGWANAVGEWTGILNVKQENRDLPCTWLLRQMTIFWDGLVPQCDGDWDGKTKMGDVNKQSIYEIWNGPLKKLRDRHMKLDFDFEPCRNCEDWQAGTSTWVEIQGKN